MSRHYCNAIAACLFALLWGVQVAAGRPVFATLNALMVVFYVYEASRARVE